MADRLIKILVAVAVLGTAAFPCAAQSSPGAADAEASSAEPPAGDAQSAAPARSPSTSPSAAPQQGVKLKSIFEYQQQLGLSAKQAQKMKDTWLAFLKDLQTAQSKLKKLQTELTGEIEEEGSIDLIRATLQQMGRIQIEMKITDILTSRKINAVMTASQLAKWRGIQKKARVATPGPAPSSQE